MTKYLIKGVLKGMRVTVGNLFKRPLTIRYPYQETEVSGRFRGEHLFDITRCKSCGLCSRVCPSRAIEMVKINEKMYPQIDIGKCSFCGLCVENCPTGALSMTKNFSLATREPETLLKKPQEDNIRTADLKTFLDKRNRIAIVGVSSDPRKWGHKIYKTLRSTGFEVYPINPKYSKIGDDPCYPNLKSLPKKPDTVITVVPPSVTENIVRECKNLKIERVWMQPGSESKDSIYFCDNNNIKVLYNSCFVVNGLKKNFGD